MQHCRSPSMYLISQIKHTTTQKDLEHNEKTLFAYPRSAKSKQQSGERSTIPAFTRSHTNVLHVDVPYVNQRGVAMRLQDCSMRTIRWCLGRTTMPSLLLPFHTSRTTAFECNQSASKPLSRYAQGLLATLTALPWRLDTQEIPAMLPHVSAIN